MRDSLSLQLALHRRQQREISRVLEDRPAALRAYERRYRRATATFERICPESEVHRAVRSADAVLIGDYHSLPAAQATYLSLVQTAMQDERPVVLALEFLESRHQNLLDRYLAGRVSDTTLLNRSAMAPFWKGFAPVFHFARRQGLRAVAIDSRPPGNNALEKRDAHAAKRILEAASAPERPRVLALMGQFHIAPGHLPQALAQLSPELKQLTVYQNCESIHWELAKLGRARSRAVEVRPGELCLMHTSPVDCQKSFLEYLEAAQ